MKKYFIILLALCSTALIGTSCKSRCTRGEEKAFNMPKDSRLIGMWKKIDVFPGQESTMYMKLEANGVRKKGSDPYFVKEYDIWYTIDGYLYDYTCIKINPHTDKSKYTIRNDTLIRISKNSKYGDLEIIYVKVKGL